MKNPEGGASSPGPQKKQMPSEELTINVNGENVRLVFPTVGELIDIEIRKVKLSNSQHSMLLSSKTFAGQYAYMLIEMIAFFEVVFPKLGDRLNVGSLVDLKFNDISGLFEEYSNKVFPWLQAWTDHMRIPLQKPAKDGGSNP